MTKKPTIDLKGINEPPWIKGNRGVWLLILVIGAIYLPTLWFDFSPMDEQWVFLDKKVFMGNISNLPQLFVHPALVMYYRPLWTSSFMIDLVTGHGSPFTFHLTNIILHVGCSLLVFALFLQLGIQKEVAFFASLLFGVHPLNISGVAWIPGRNDSLLCLFSLLSFIFLLRFIKTGKLYHVFLQMLFFIMALLVKENAIVLPVLYLLIYALLAKKKSRLTLVSLVSGWAIVAVGWFFFRKSIVDYFPPVLGAGLGENLLHSFEALLIYTGKFILPIQQSVLPVLKETSLIPGGIILLIVSVLFVKYHVKNKNIALLGLAIFYLFLLIPVWVGVTNPTGEQYEHRMYTSVAGGLLFMSQLKLPLSKKMLRILMLIIFIGFSIKTVSRSPVYKDAYSFAEAGTSESPSFVFFNIMKGNIYIDRKDYDKAVESFNKAIELKPDRFEFYNNRGRAYYLLKDYNNALADFTKVLDMKENQVETLVDRSLVYYKMGDYHKALYDLVKAKKLGAKNISPAYIRDLSDALHRTEANTKDQETK